jgi:hypothetical protein
MTRTILKQAGEALWGPQYRSEMARQLRVHLRTVMRWDAGETAIPASAGRRLAELLEERQARIGLVLSRLRKPKQG